MTVNTLSGFSSTQRFETANLTAPQANLTGFSVWAVILPTTTTSNQMIFGKSTGVGNNTGWIFGNSGGFGLRVGDGSTAKVAPRVGFVADELDTIQILHGVIRDNVMYSYKNGVKVDGSTSITALGSYTGPLRIGALSDNTRYMESILSVGICGTHGLTDEQVESHYQALLLDINAAATSASHHWVAEDASATWVDRISSLSAARTGTITPASVIKDFPLYRFIDTDYAFDTDAMLPVIPNTAGSMKVLPVGDSRTFGAGGTGSNAWRNGVAVLKNLTDDINNIDFVGSVTSSAIDPQHFGWSGSDNRNHVNVTGDVNVSPATLVSIYSPKVVVHWLGVNGTNYDEDVAAEKQAYLDLMRAYYDADNTIRFLLLDEATIAEAWHNAGLENFRLWQRYVAWPLLKSEGLQIYTMYNPLKPSLGHYADPLHPNDTGYAVLADDIYAALRNVFGVDYVEPVVVPRMIGVTKLVRVSKLIF